MTDLVDRLSMAGGDICREAADEIDRLKNEVRYQGEHICATNDRLIAANAEIERLRAEVEEWKRQASIWKTTAYL